MDKIALYYIIFVSIYIVTLLVFAAHSVLTEFIIVQRNNYSFKWFKHNSKKVDDLIEQNAKLRRYIDELEAKNET